MDADAVLLGEILAGGLVRTVFQPIVDLDSGGTVGYEALSRAARNAARRARPAVRDRTATRSCAPAGHAVPPLGPADRHPRRHRPTPP